MKSETTAQLPKVFLRERLYVHKSLMTDRIRRRFSTIIPDYFPEFNEQTGEPNEVRDLLVRGWRRCPNGEWYSISRGNLDAVWDEFSGHCEIVEQRATPALSFNLRFMGVLMKDNVTRSGLRETQVPFVADILRNGYGIGEAPPRFGKTICMSAIVCQVGMRALLIVHQVELAEQFVAKFRRCTNVDAAERHYKRQLIGICDKWSDFDNFDICVTTWQRFHAVLPKNEDEGLPENEYIDPELLRMQREKLHAQQIKRFEETQRHIVRLRNRFGIVLVDEVHRAASPCFSRVVDQFNPWYRLGVTATPDRKDKLDAVIKLIVGPTVTVGEEDKVELRVRPVYTGFNPKFQNWTTYENKIAKDPRRNKLACDLIEKDVKDGHHVVVVCTRTDHIIELSEKLRARGISVATFHGKMHKRDRKQAMADAESGKAKVTISMRSMLLGIDIPLWSSMHVLVPSANPPNYYQEISRVRTVTDIKPFALIRDYIDVCSAGTGSYRTRHQVYTDPRKAPIFFENDDGSLMDKVSCARIVTQAMQARQAGSREAKADFKESMLGFGGITGPRMPKFDDSGWGGLAHM